MSPQGRGPLAPRRARAHLDALRELHAPTTPAAPIAEVDADKRARAAFDALTPAERLEAIAGMRREGHSLSTIATATGMCVEAVRELLGPSSQ